MPTPTPILINDLIASNTQIGQLVSPEYGPAVVNFFDFFFSDNLGVPANNFNAFIQWQVSGGSVDLVGGVGPGVFGAPPEQPTGRYVDLGGSTANPGLFETKTEFPVVAGQTYNLTFDYRSTGGDLDSATASVGGKSFSVSSSSTSFKTFSQDFTATETGLYHVAFQGAEGDRDNSGIGIDGVLFGQVLPVVRMGTNGNDSLLGRGASDFLIGGDGNDLLDGAGNADVMYGGNGNDRFYVDNAGDRTIETTGQGTDTVYASADYRLEAGQAIEGLVTTSLTGTSSIRLTGNELAQTISGNSGNNILSGLGGNDVMRGYAGNDFLIGGDGNDVFVFNTAPNASTNVDTISDFSNASGNNDRIYLDDAIFTKIGAEGAALTAGMFAANVKGTAADGNDHVIYDTDSGNLYYDSNGNVAGGSVLFAVLTGHPALTAADFFVV